MFQNICSWFVDLKIYFYAWECTLHIHWSDQTLESISRNKTDVLIRPHLLDPAAVSCLSQKVNWQLSGGYFEPFDVPQMKALKKTSKRWNGFWLGKQRVQERLFNSCTYKIKVDVTFSTASQQLFWQWFWSHTFSMRKIVKFAIFDL